MKPAFLTILLFIASGLLSHAQSFTKHINSIEDEFVYTSINAPGGGNIIYMVAGEWDNDPGRRTHRDIILKTDQEGNIIDSLVFYDNDSLKFLITQLIPHGDDFLIQGINYLAADLERSVSCRIVRCDFDLQLLSDFTLNDQQNYITCGSALINSNNHLLLSGIYTAKDLSGNYWFCMETTLDGDLIKQQTSNEMLPYSSIIQLSDDEVYNIMNYKRIVKVDTNLNYVEDLYNVPTLLYPDTMYRLFKPKSIDGLTYLVSGNTFDGNYKAAWGVFNSGIWENVFSFGPVDTNNFMKGTDFLTLQSIYTTISHEPDYPVTEFSQIDNQMLLYSTTIDNNINWMKRYDGKGWIHAVSPLATSDGGCLWIGNYWDWHHKTHQDYDVIIMKINPDGSFFEEITKPEQLEQRLIFFTNPGTDIEFSTELTQSKLLIYNTSGKVVIEADIEPGRNKIAASHLAAGIYFYQLFHKNKVVESGKWIKD